MANETTQRNKTNRNVAEQAAQTKESVQPATEQVLTSEANEPKKPLVPKAVDPNQIVTVRNGFQGKLVYKSKRTGELWIWDAFGDEQDMELSELKNARNSNKRFFIDNWFLFDEEWIIEYLGMGRYYKFSLRIDDFDKLFEKPASEIEEAISKLSAGQRKSVAYRAKELIGEEKIDSHKVITTLEKCLGVELIER